MNEWNTIRIEKLAAKDIENSFVDGDWIESEHIVNEGIRIIQTGNIGIGKYLDKIHSKKYISEKSFIKLKCKKVLPGDLLICRLADPIGRSCLVPHGEEFYVTSVDVVILRPCNQYSKKYLLYHLNHSKILKLAKDYSAGSTRQRVSRTNYGQIQINLPPLPEQKLIAEILSSADEAIDQTGKLIAKYHRIKKGLMQDLLTLGIDEHGNIRNKNTHKFVLKNGIEVPEEWEVKSFKESCEIIKDGTHLPPKRVEEGNWLLGVTNIIDGELRITSSDTKVSEEFFNQMHKNWSIERGDVLLAIVGATIGKVTQVPTVFPTFTIQRSLCLLRGKKDELHNDYLRLFIESKKFQRILWNEVNVTAQPGIYLDTIGKFKIQRPGYNEQKRILDRINSLKRLMDDLKHNLQKLNSIKTGLMQDLISGNVRVKLNQEM